MPVELNNKPRCFGSTSKEYAKYHDEEWGVPVYDLRSAGINADKRFHFKRFKKARHEVCWLNYNLYLHASSWYCE